MSRARVVLHLMMKDEARNLPRLLASALPHVDGVLAYDTGSKDRSKEILQEACDRAKAPCLIADGVFRDYGQARAEGLTWARSVASSFPLGSPSDYLLLLDADHELEIVDPAWRERLTESAYEIEQRSATMTYRNVRLIRASLRGARYVGRTHEYLSTGRPTHPLLEGITVIDHESGQNRSGKFERDVGLLLLDLADNPKNARAMFYLGQTYEGLGLYGEAARWLDKRIAAGGNSEEVWTARYIRARCLSAAAAKTDDPQLRGAAMEAALDAFETSDPPRAEPLAVLVSHLRGYGAHRIAAILAEAGLRIEPPKNKRLFVEDVSTTLKSEIGICAHSFPDGLADRLEIRAAGAAATRELATRRDLTPEIRLQNRKNQRLYTRSLAGLAGVSPDKLPTRTLQVERPAGWGAFNPSVIRRSGGRLQTCVRTANYEMFGAGGYKTHDGSDIMTRNVLADLDADGRVIRERPFVDEDTRERPYKKVRGYEDVRLFEWHGQLWGSSTVRDQNRAGRAEIALLQLVETDSSVHVVRSVVQRYGTPAHQKNWMPFVDSAGRLLFVYSTDPTVILKVDSDDPSLQAEETYRSAPPLFLEGIRGSSQLVAWGPDDHLAVVHESIRNDADGEMGYYHRFAVYDKYHRLSVLSDPFFFEDHQIEFCAGLALPIEGDDALLSYGVRDSIARLVRIDLEYVRRILQAGHHLSYSNERPAKPEEARRKSFLEVNMETTP